MNKSEKIQAEVDSIIKSAEAMYNFSRMNRATMKAQNELRELGLEQYVPAWVMQKGANSDRIVNELIKSAKQDGTKAERGYGFMNADGDGEFVAGRTIPASALYTLLNEVEEAEEPVETNVLDTLTDKERKMFIRTAHSTGLYGKDRQGWCRTSENEEMINKLVNAGLVEIAEVRHPLMGTICKEGAIVLKATKKGLRIEGALFIEQAKNASNYGMTAPWRKHQD